MHCQVLIILPVKIDKFINKLKIDFFDYLHKIISQNSIRAFGFSIKYLPIEHLDVELVDESEDVIFVVVFVETYDRI